MTKKIINSVISKKINNWLISIEDEEVKESIREDCIVTGGSIVSLLLNEKPKDFDIYFKTKETVKKVTEYYIDQYKKNNPNNYSKIFVIDVGENVEKLVEIFLNHNEFDNEEDKQSAIEEYKKELTFCDPERIRIMIPSKGIAEDEELLENPSSDIVESMEELDSINNEILNEIDTKNNTTDKPDTPKKLYRPVFFSSNAITLSERIQIIARFYGDPEIIHKNYDFAHCTNYWTFKEGVVFNEKALECILTKQLLYIGSKYPLCSVIRTRKFIKRGWSINAGQYLKMMFQIGELDLTNPWVLEDQLIGVDSAYFNILIEAIKNKVKEDPTYIIHDSYLISIIDRIF